MDTATFGAGCFWGVEHAFRQVKGVIETAVGYMGGNTKNPTYKEVCTDKTGHAEVVQIKYDEEVLPYEELLSVFWEIHDPTQVNMQWPDVGTQYRSAIFYHSEKQKKAAEISLVRLKRSGKYKKDIATEIKPASEFYMAEEYHQRYYERHAIDSCVIKGPP